MRKPHKCKKCKKVCIKCKKVFYLRFPRKYCGRKCYESSLLGRKMDWLYKWRHTPRSEEYKKKLKESIKRGKESPNWSGGKVKDSNGYIHIFMPKHPFAIGNYVREHRLVMEKFLGRYLQPSEHIHHKNAVKDDNRIENLQIIYQSPHYGEVKCPNCKFLFLIQ